MGSPPTAQSSLSCWAQHLRSATQRTRTWICSAAVKEVAVTRSSHCWRPGRCRTPCALRTACLPGCSAACDVGAQHTPHLMPCLLSVRRPRAYVSELKLSPLVHVTDLTIRSLSWSLASIWKQVGCLFAASSHAVVGVAGTPAHT